MVQLAREHDLILHAHADADAIIGLYNQYPEARIIWAHAGFEYSSKVKELMDIFPNLWADLSFRWEIHTTNRFLPTWDSLLVEHADRFMLGVDTYTPQRWLKIQDTLDWYNRLFSSLPPEVADKIRYQNAHRLFANAYD
jgi:predicted TIM-barrel fold metal-dependent hydrolase